MYDGIERTHELIKESKELSNEIEELEKDPNMDFNVYRKEEALKYLAFYKKHKGDFKICNIALTYPNNWILIDSVQTVFFINLNFKLLNIVNNIKNRRPNLEDEYPKIESLFTLYEENGDDKVLIQLGHEIHRFLVDIDFMSKYWFSLLDYLGYDPMPIKHEQSAIRRCEANGCAGTSRTLGCKYHNEYLRSRHKGGDAYFRKTA